jgi:hypothetical protein
LAPRIAKLEAYDLALYKLSLNLALSLEINSNMPYDRFHIMSMTVSKGLAASEHNGHLSWFLIAAEALRPSSCAAHICFDLIDSEKQMAVCPLYGAVFSDIHQDTLLIAHCRGVIKYDQKGGSLVLQIWATLDLLSA